MITLLVAGALTGTFCVTLSLTGSNLEYFPGDLGDARLNAYFLEHGFQYFVGNQESFWNAPFLYPEPEVISYSENHLGSVPLYSIFRILGFDLFAAFQLWFILVFLLNYLAAWLFIKWLLKDPYAAVIGAFVFAFSLALQPQMSHAQVFPRYFIPLAFMMLLKFRESTSPIHLFLAVLFCVGQLYCSIYPGMLLIIPFGITFILVCISSFHKLQEKIQNLRWMLLLLSAIALNCLFAYLLIEPYIRRAALLPLTPYSEILPTIPGWESYFYSHPGSMLWGVLTGPTAYPTYWYALRLFPGGIVMAGIFVSVGYILMMWKKVQINLKILLLVMLITLGLFMRISGFSLYVLINALPGYQAIRAVHRLFGIELLFFSVFTAYFIQYITSQVKLKSKALIYLVVLILCIADGFLPSEHTFRTNKETALNRTQYLTLKMKDLPSGSIISYESASIDNPILCHPDAMLATHQLNLVSINAYTSTSPWSYASYWYKPDSAAREHWLGYMEYIGYPRSEIAIVK